jgi:hypothetical protein
MSIGPDCFRQRPPLRLPPIDAVVIGKAHDIAGRLPETQVPGVREMAHLGAYPSHREGKRFRIGPSEPIVGILVHYDDLKIAKVLCR